MNPSQDQDREQAFRHELLARGWVTEEQLAEADRLRAAAEDLGQPAGLDDVLVRKGYVTAERTTTARREVAAKTGAALKIGKYEILERIGEGGAGIVYRAFQTTLGREVALKVLTNKRVGDAEYLDRFLREAKVAVTLNHVNIVRGLDFGQADGYHYFAMELVDGETLLNVIKREGRLTEKKAFDAVLQMVRALEHAGKFQIVHRDIKPENILVTRTGTAKLCDLGLARPVIEGGAADSQGRPMGTALYVAPEQIRREAKLDFRADMYSLGATLYHCLTGTPPYVGKTVTEIVRGHLSGPIPNPRDSALDVSTGAAAVVMKMLAKDPADRYQNLEALDEDLDSVLAGRPPVNTITVGRRPTSLAGEGAPARAGERRGGRRSAGPFVAGISVAVLAGGAWFMFGREKAPAPAPVAVTPLTQTPSQTAALDASKMREQRDSEAAALLAEADAFAKGKAPDAPEAAAKYQELAGSHPDTPAGRLAKQKSAEMEKTRTTRIAAALKERADASDKALLEGRLGAAIAAWNGLTPEVEAAGGRAAAEAARVKAEETGKKRLESAKALATKVLAGDAASEEPARRALKAASACGLPAVDAEAEKSLVALETALRERGEALRAAEEAWPRVCAESLTAAAASMREGTAVLDAASGVLAPVGKRVEELRKAIALVGAFSESIRGGFSRAAAAGESVRLRVPSRPGGSISGRASGLRPDGFEIQRGPAAEAVAARDVHPEDLAAFAWKVLGAGSPEDHVGAAAFLLGRGSFPAADREIEILEVMGAKDRADLVRSLVSAVRGNARQRADAALREAEVLRLQKRSAEARAAYERAVAVCDGYAPTLWKQGAFLLEASKDPAEALRSLEAAAALDPADPEAWYWIGEGRRRAGKTEEAMAALDRFLKSTPADDPRREAVRKAQEELRASATAASMKQVREDAARTYRKDEYAASEELWRKVLAASPDDTEAMYFLGKSLLALDRRIDAYAWLRKFLGVEKRTGSRTDDAKKIVKDLEQRFGDSPAAIRKAQEGSNLINQGAWSAGIDALTSSLDLAPLRAESYMERGRGHLHGWATEGRKEHLHQAAKDLETAVLINDRLGRGWSILAETRFRLDDMPGAVDASARAVQFDPSWVKAWEYRARSLNRAGRHVEAEQAAAEGLVKEPTPNLYVARGEARLGLGKIKEAKADVDAAAMKFNRPLNDEEKAYRLDVLSRIRRSGGDSE